MVTAYETYPRNNSGNVCEKRLKTNNRAVNGDTVTDTPKRKIYQTCRFCGGEFGTRGIRNHETKCAKTHAADLPAQPPDPADPPELPDEQPDENQPKLKPLTLLKPLEPKPQTEPPKELETVDEIKTLSGDAIKIIKNAAPKIDPNAPLPSEGGGMADLMKQAEMVGDLNKIVHTDGVQVALKGVGSLLEAAAEKLRGGVVKTATGTTTAKTPEEDFLEKFAQGLV